MKPTRSLNRQGVPILDPPRNARRDRAKVGPCPPHRYVVKTIMAPHDLDPENDPFEVEVCVRCGKLRGTNSW